MLTLRYHGTTIPVEAECLTPDNLAGKSAAEVAALPVQHGNAPAPLGEFFKVSGDASDGEVTLEGDCSRFQRLTGWKPTIPFEVTLKDVLSYWRQRV